MEQLVAILAWPAVALLLSLFALVLFRVPIGTLINRTKKVGKSGIETYEGQPTQAIEEKRGVEEFFRTFDSPMLLEGEKRILEDLRSRHIETPADRERTLVRALAATNVILHFERAAGGLWASQLACLRYLNPRGERTTNRNDILPFYELAKAQYPAWYENYSFDRWLEFLRSFNLVSETDSTIFITVAGREFLKYLAASGKPEPYYG